MPKRVLTGTVVSDKADKTVVVRVERRVKHPLYGKIIRLSKKYHAHDQDNNYRSGEQVRIEECAPISKLKTWSVIDRIGEAKAAPVEIVEGATAEAEAAATAAVAKAAKSTSKKADAAKAQPAPVEAEAPEQAPVEAPQRPTSSRSRAECARCAAPSPASGRFKMNAPRPSRSRRKESM